MVKFPYIYRLKLSYPVTEDSQQPGQQNVFREGMCQMLMRSQVIAHSLPLDLAHEDFGDLVERSVLGWWEQKTDWDSLKMECNFL